MNDSDLTEDVRIKFPRLVRPYVRTPIRRCAVILATITSLATADYFYYNLLLDGWTPTGCIPEPTCADTVHVQFAFSIYQWSYAIMVSLSLLLLAIWLIIKLKVIDDSFRRTRFRNPDALRKRLNTILIGIRRGLWGALLADSFILLTTIAGVLFFTPN